MTPDECHSSPSGTKTAKGVPPVQLEGVFADIRKSLLVVRMMFSTGTDWCLA